jgi:hypothetical protein
VLTTHAGTIRYAREADTLLFFAAGEAITDLEPSDALSAATFLHLLC